MIPASHCPPAKSSERSRLTRISASVAIAPLDFGRTFVLQNLGHYDPTAALGQSHFTKAFMGPSGICSVAMQPAPGGLLLACEGPDAAEIHAQLLASISASATGDGYHHFQPQHPVLERLHREQAGLRLVRVPWLFDIACSAVLQQRVRSTDAMSDWRHIANRFGSRSSAGACAFPSPASLAALAPWQLEALGIDAKRARTLIALAREIRLNPLRPAMTFAQLRGRLARVPGVGPWTVETVLGFGAADPDALPLGDLYLPHLVAFTLAGESEGSDTRMIELLEPFRGQRFRVARLILGSGIALPRTGPRRSSDGSLLLVRQRHRNGRRRLPGLVSSSVPTPLSRKKQRGTDLKRQSSRSFLDPFPARKRDCARVTAPER